MNKKILLFSVLGIFALGLVVAGVITYYTQVQQDFDIQSPISDNSEGTILIGGEGEYLESPQLGALVSATNLAPFDVNVNVNSVAMEGDVTTDDITTSYVNELRLSKKVVAFGTNNWEEVSDTNVMVEYPVVGENLLAEVVEGEEVGYVLIYYADNVNRFNNVEKAVIIGDVDASLPYAGDENAVGGMYDYCTAEENYETCHGAKIWYIPSKDIDNDGNIDWTLGESYYTENFYFETDLIHYFKTDNGNTIIPEGVTMEFLPKYEFGAINGTYTVTTSVIPA